MKARFHGKLHKLLTVDKTRTVNSPYALGGMTCYKSIALLLLVFSGMLTVLCSKIHPIAKL
jgi:hypothetical protein